MAFSWFPKLEYLDLSNSSGMSVNGLGEAWIGMSNNSKLKILNLKNFGKKSISVDMNTWFFKFFNFDNLEILHLDSSFIEGAEGWKFANKTKNLKKLSISNNYLNFSQLAKLTTNIQNLQYLTDLDLSNQIPKRSSISSAITFQMNLPPNLENLDLSRIQVWPSYQLHLLKMTFRNRGKLKRFWFKRNHVEEIDIPFIENPNPDIPLEVDFFRNRL